VVEISCHGSPVVLRHAVERALAAGARLAGPGEFTLRAFLNGRIDLPQAEAVRDLIDATTLYQARVAARQAGGAVSRSLAPFKESLLELIALLEAGIDFAEDDVGVASAEEILARLHPVLDGIARLAASFQYGTLVTGGLSLAIVGRPNVGKCSIINAITQSERVIDSPIPKNRQPNFAPFMREIRSSMTSRLNPVSAICSSPTGCPLMSARRIVISSKSFPGRIWRKMSAALALFVSRMSTNTMVRSFRPRGKNLLFCMMVYLVKCLGWHSAGLPPQ